jgi:hypothetical protein
MSSCPEAERFLFPPFSVPYDPSPEMHELTTKCLVSRVHLPDNSTAWLATDFREVREVLIGQRYSRACLCPGQAKVRHRIGVANGCWPRIRLSTAALASSWRARSPESAPRLSALRSRASPTA